MEATPTNKAHSFGERWSPALHRFGHTQISNFFLRYYHKLQLTHGEAMFVVHLMQHKWDKYAPYPSYKTLGERMGVSIKSARRFAASLQQKGFLWRQYTTGRSNQFGIIPLTYVSPWA